MAETPLDLVGGRYRVLGTLGKGAMGLVFMAHDPVLDRKVAIKQMTAEIADNEELRQRFYVEARAAARLNHPNIITIHELSESGGEIYMVMELLEGKSLASLIQERAVPLSLEATLDVMAQVCDGLDYAHQRAIVHRDIKPANLFVTPSGTAKVLDFGIARLGSLHMTAAGALIGTPDYMSPEQVRGDEIDRRTDLWAVGAVLYQLLSGAKPFEGKPLARLLMAITQTPHVPLQQRAPSVPRSVSDLVDRLLSKPRDARPASAGLVRDELRAILGRESSTSTRARLSDDDYGETVFMQSPVAAAPARIPQVPTPPPPAPPTPPPVRLPEPAHEIETVAMKATPVETLAPSGRSMPTSTGAIPVLDLPTRPVSTPPSRPAPPPATPARPTAAAAPVAPPPPPVASKPAAAVARPVVPPVPAPATAPPAKSGRSIAAVVAVLVVGLLGLLSVAGGAWWYFRPAQTPATTSATAPAGPAAGAAGTQPAQSGTTPSVAQPAAAVEPPPSTATQLSASAEPPPAASAANTTDPKRTKSTPPAPSAPARTETDARPAPSAAGPAPAAGKRGGTAPLDSGVTASQGRRETLRQDTVDALAGRSGQAYDGSQEQSNVAAVNRINEVLGRYVQALVHGDEAVLGEVRTSLSSEESGFVRARALKVRLDGVRVEVNGTEATARCRRTVEGTSAFGTSIHEEGNAVFRLTRKVTGWMITDVR
ncbi:MAG TPA: serine/threonine-protein kinase [Vicinamibacterales bacterium]|jgi:serine/threonine-protein kinase